MLPLTEGEMRSYLGSIMEDPRVQSLMAYIRDNHQGTVDEQCEIASIEAPPLDEGRRAADFAMRLSETGLLESRVDEHGNALALIPGTGRHGDMLIEAHLDTVFPLGSVKQVVRTEGRVEAPGICDNCRGLAALLCIARGLQHAGISPEKDITVAGTSGEEGIGDLLGMKGLFSKDCGNYDYSISLDGHGKGHFVFDGAGSRRYEVSFHTPGGHSWTDFGMPSAVHAMGRAISSIAGISTGESPKTTYNVGLASGGTSVNAIAQHAAITLDMRSESPEALDELERKVFEAIGRACDAEGADSPRAADVKVSFKKIGDRPAGSQAPDSPIIIAAKVSSEIMGLRFDKAGPSSTNANVPISCGVPCLCMGAGGEGGGIYTTEEWFDPSDGWKGIQQAALLLLACAGVS